MSEHLKIKIDTDLQDLIDYINTCKIDEDKLYNKLVNTFNDLGPLFHNFIKNPISEEDYYKNACIALWNAFKHQYELKKDYSELKIIEYGASLDCPLEAPFGDVVYFKNADILNELKDNNNYIYFNKTFNGKRLDMVLKKIKKIVGDQK
jgi:hypothetical protein